MSITFTGLGDWKEKGVSSDITSSMGFIYIFVFLIFFFKLALEQIFWPVTLQASWEIVKECNGREFGHESVIVGVTVEFFIRVRG